MASTELNVDSPRVKAAMKVLGVHPRDVEPKELASFEGDEFAKTHKLELYDKKRAALLSQVNALAAKGNEVGQSSVISSSDREEKNAAFMAAVAKAEQENIARMHKMAQKEVQKVVIQELETKLKAQQAAEKQKESHQRFKELLKKRDDALKVKKKEGLKKQEKTLEVRNRADKAVLQRSEEIAKASAEKHGAVEVRQQAIVDGRADGRVKNAEKMEKAAELKDKFERNFMKTQERKYAEVVEKHASKIAVLEALDEARKSNNEEWANRVLQGKDRVRSAIELRQSEIEKKYWAACDRQTAAEKVRTDHLAATMKEFKKKNTVAKNAHEGRYNSIKSELERDQEKIMEELLKKDEKIMKNQELAKTSGAAQLANTVAHHAAHVDIVAGNRDRNRRAHHHALVMRLDKLQMTRAKVEVMEASKIKADQKRMEVMANCAREKMQLEHKVERLKNSKNPDSMQAFLDTITPEPEALARINELMGHLGLSAMAPKEGEEEGK